jgi:hypothetical protein
VFRRLLVVCALLLALPTTAGAATYKHQRPITGARAKVVQIAAKFWDDRGVHGCVPKLLKAPSLLDSDGVNASGRGDETACTIWVKSSIVRRARRDPVMLVGLCSVVVHETGHARGLEHTPDGIMAAVPQVDPFACEQLARHLFPLRRIHGGVSGSIT